MSIALPRFEEGQLRVFAEHVLQHGGARERDAKVVVDSLVDADRRGVHSHGLARIPSYLAQMRAGEIDVQAEPELIGGGGPVARVEGRLCFGAVLGRLAIDEACALAERYGIGAVVVRDATHFGAAGYYARRAASRGLIGVSATNTPAVMAPFGGIEARLGNNPIAVAAPVAGRQPFVLDMAHTHVARGRIKLAELRGEKIPAAWALDAEGRRTTDPTAALDGVLLPFGGYKGYALALVVELLSGVLSGSGLSHELVNTGLTGRVAAGSAPTERGVGNLHLALDPAAFVGREAFAAKMAELVGAMKTARVADNRTEILVPGEPEARAEERASREGVQLEPVTVEALRALATAAGVSMPGPRDRETSTTRGCRRG